VIHGDGDATVLVCHGFKGFKDWGMFPWLCDRIAASGLRAVRFDFSHNGVEEHDFDRLDLFLLDTFTRHQEDLAAVAARFPGPLGLLGHSRGGADALLFAPTEPRVRCVATLAAVAYPARWPDDAEQVFREKGHYPFPNARTGQIMSVARSQWDDAKRHSVKDAVQGWGRPLLLVHGTSDASVPASDADEIAAWHGGAQVLRVESAGHTFGAVHPFQGSTPYLEDVAEETTAFFRRHLR
jgi:pimeloyl-ACP methyl ester carboxylesterase